MTGVIGVAISTTGDEHRMGFLETCVKQWRAVLPLGSVLVVTVDGSAADASRVAELLKDGYGAFYRVGQPDVMEPLRSYNMKVIREFPQSDRLGVATNKNTGIELLMEQPVEHLFLCDDDTWPLYTQSLEKHIKMGAPHNMVCWGKHRIDYTEGMNASWTWPRGVLLYTHRSVVEKVGGMREEFGPGGHEHVEWSQRIFHAGLTEEMYLSPASYATRGGLGAAALWHAEDMPRIENGRVELLGNYRLRKKKTTSIRRKDGDWVRINEIMEAAQGQSGFVPYTALENGRASATICRINPRPGAEESK